MTENKKGKEKMYDELKDMDYSGSAIYIYTVYALFIFHSSVIFEHYVFCTIK